MGKLFRDGSEKWKSGRVKYGGMMESERKENILISFSIWLGVEKWNNEKNKFV